MSDAATNKVATNATAATQKFISLLKNGFRAQNLTQEGSAQNGFSSALDEAVSTSLQKADDLHNRRDMNPAANERDDARASVKKEPVRRNDDKDSSPREAKTEDSRRVEPREARQDTKETTARQSDDQTTESENADAPKAEAKKDPSFAIKKKENIQNPAEEKTDLAQKNAGDILQMTGQSTSEDLCKTQDGAEKTTSSEDAATTLLNLAENEQAALALLNKMIERQEEILSLRETDATRAQDGATDSDAATEALTGQNQPQTAQDLMAAQAAKMNSRGAHNEEHMKNSLLSGEAKIDGPKTNNSNDLLATAQTETGSTNNKDDLSKFDLLKLAKQLEMAKEAPSSLATLQNIAAKAAQAGQTGQAGQMQDMAATTATTQTNASSITGPSSSTPATGAAGLKMASLYETHGANATHLTKGGPSSQLNVVEQVSVHLHKQVKAGNDQMTLQLRPEELGRIDIKLDFADDKSVTGKVIVDNPTTLEMLTKDASSLQRALQDAGLRADAGCLQFSLRGDGQSGMAFQNQQGNDRQNTNNTPQILAENDNLMNDTNSIETYYISPNRVNLRI